MNTNQTAVSIGNRAEVELLGLDWTARLNSVIRSAPRDAVIVTHQSACQAGQQMARRFGRTDLIFTEARIH